MAKLFGNQSRAPPQSAKRLTNASTPVMHWLAYANMHVRTKDSSCGQKTAKHPPPRHWRQHLYVHTYYHYNVYEVAGTTPPPPQPEPCIPSCSMHAKAPGGLCGAPHKHIQRPQLLEQQVVAMLINSTPQGLPGLARTVGNSPQHSNVPT